MNVRLTFLRAERIPRGLLLVFDADGDFVVREASVVVPVRGRISTVLFPHSESESGESLGSDDADEAVCSGARQLLAVMEAMPIHAAFLRETS